MPRSVPFNGTTYSLPNLSERGWSSQINAWMSDVSAHAATKATAQTLTNKTLTAPTITSPTITGTSSIAVQAWIEVGSGGGAPAFQNSFVNAASGFSTVAFMKDPMGFVHLKGLCVGGMGTTVFTLPSGYRPALTSGFSSFTTPDGVSFSWALVSIDTNGAIAVGVDIPSIGFDGITFKAA